MFLEIYCFFVTLLLVFVSYFAYRLWGETENQDKALESIHGHMNLLHSMCIRVLDKEIYTDDPVIRAYVNVLDDINHFLHAYNDQFQYDEDTPLESENLKGYEDLEIEDSKDK